MTGGVLLHEDPVGRARGEPGPLFHQDPVDRRLGARGHPHDPPQQRGGADLHRYVRLDPLLHGGAHRRRLRSYRREVAAGDREVGEARLLVEGVVGGLQVQVGVVAGTEQRDPQEQGDADAEHLGAATTHVASQFDMQRLHRAPSPLQVLGINRGIDHLVGDELSRAHPQDTVGAPGDRPVVRDQHDRATPTGGHAPQERAGCDARSRGRAHRWARRRKDRRVLRDGARDRDPLLLATGELIREVVRPVSESDLLQQPGRSSASRPVSSSTSSMFSRAVKVGIRLKNWKTNPTRSRRNAVSPRSSSSAMS